MRLRVELKYRSGELTVVEATTGFHVIEPSRICLSRDEKTGRERIEALGVDELSDREPLESATAERSVRIADPFAPNSFDSEAVLLVILYYIQRVQVHHWPNAGLYRNTLRLDRFDLDLALQDYSKVPQPEQEALAERLENASLFGKVQVRDA